MANAIAGTIVNNATAYSAIIIGAVWMVASIKIAGLAKIPSKILAHVPLSLELSSLNISSITFLKYRFEYFKRKRFIEKFSGRVEKNAKDLVFL